MERHEILIQQLRRAATEGIAETKLKKGAGATSAITKLKAEGLIRSIKFGRTSRCFLTEHAPTLDRASKQIEALLSDAGLKLTSLSKLEKDVTRMKTVPKQLFEDAISALKGDGRIVEVRDARKSKFFLHREPLLEQLQLDASDWTTPSASSPVSGISLDQVRAAYETLKSEQGGINTVAISDVLKRTKCTKADLHRLLLEQAARDQVTLHPATTTNLSNEELAAGIKLEGEPHAFITFTLKGHV